MTPYNEREVLKLLQEESTQRKGFELIVAQYSEQLYWQIRRYCRMKMRTTFCKTPSSRHGQILTISVPRRSCLRGSTVLR